MNEEEFRARFDADRRANRLTWIYDEASTAMVIALGLNRGSIVGRNHHGNMEVPLATSRIVEGTANG